MNWCTWGALHKAQYFIWPCWCFIISPSPCNPISRYYYAPHFTDRRTEAWACKVTSPKSHIWLAEMAKLRFEPSANLTPFLHSRNTEHPLCASRCGHALKSAFLTTGDTQHSTVRLPFFHWWQEGNVFSTTAEGRAPWRCGHLASQVASLDPELFTSQTPLPWLLAFSWERCPRFTFRCFCLCSS